MLQADTDARVAALLLAIDPARLKGAVVRGRSAILCEQWTSHLTAMLPKDAPIKRIPSNITQERLLGGLDFAATLSSGQAVCERGVLASAHQGLVLLSAGTTRASTFTHVARALDSAGVRVERDGFSETHPASFAAVVNVTDDDESVPAGIEDRVAFIVHLNETSRHAWNGLTPITLVTTARERLRSLHHDDATLVALTQGASRLGITSTRVVMLALSTARAHAAFLAHAEVQEDDIACAARLVLAPRATMRDALAEDNVANDDSSRDLSADGASEATVPDDAQQRAGDQANVAAADQSVIPDQPASPSTSDSSDSPNTSGNVRELTETVVRAATAALPAGLLAAAAARSSASGGNGGRAGAELTNGTRGRQIGTRRGEPRGGARLDLVATLRASIPLQRVRRESRLSGPRRVVELRRDDFRVRRCATPATTTTLFVVDASGSAALHRLGEAKGAVELMLAEGYARRDRVALIAFRGTVAELVLPPTHALTRARRAIIGMPAGGGTPLATALDLTVNVLTQLRRDNAQVVVAMLTDGRANVARDGRGGRARAESDAMTAAARVRALRTDMVWIDTSVRSEQASRNYAEAAGARYLLLPSATAHGLSSVALATRSA